MVRFKFAEIAVQSISETIERSRSSVRTACSFAVSGKIRRNSTAKLIDCSDIGEDADGECTERLVAHWMAELVIDPLEIIQIDNGNRTRNIAALSASYLLIQTFHDVTSVQYPGQLVQLR